LVAVKDVAKAALFRFELIYSTLNSARRELSLRYLEKDSYFRLCVKIETANLIGASGAEIGS
jgi:hypothetical protein